jgi:anti-sigma-K factor RskA
VRRDVAIPWFLAAAAVIALAFLTPYTVQLRNRTRELMVAVRDLTARLGDTDRQLVAVRGEVSLLTAPDVKRVDLRGQSTAPQAGARAFWSRSRGVYFVASNLPPLPAGKDYQLWFVTPTGPVSAAVFQPDPRGDAALIGNVRADMEEPNAMAVTLEPAGGLPKPSGAFYLVGPAN